MNKRNDMEKIIIALLILCIALMIHIYKIHKKIDSLSKSTYNPYAYKSTLKNPLDGIKITGISFLKLEDDIDLKALSFFMSDQVNEEQLRYIAENADRSTATAAMEALRRKYDKTYDWCPDCDEMVGSKTFPCACGPDKYTQK